jgi:hypothetical protein
MVLVSQRVRTHVYRLRVAPCLGRDGIDPNRGLPDGFLSYLGRGVAVRITVLFAAFGDFEIRITKPADLTFVNCLSLPPDLVHHQLHVNSIFSVERHRRIANRIHTLVSSPNVSYRHDVERGILAWGRDHFSDLVIKECSNRDGP